MSNLDERVSAAFSASATSSGVADLIAEAEAAAIVSAEQAETARTRALDPTLATPDVAAARREMEDGFFKRDRMHEAVRCLGERLVEVKRQEEEHRRRVAYDAALVERDALAKEIAAVYPAIAEQLTDLAARIARNDAEIERVNTRRPDGAAWIADSEMIAREVRSFNDINAAVPRITRHLRLPAFRYAALAPYTWPPARR